MKKIISIIIVIFLFSLSLAFANNNLYLHESLQLQLDINGEFELVPEISSAKVKEVSTELYLLPKESFRQNVLEINTLGEIQDDKVIYEWKDQELGTKKFNYTALIKTINKRKEVRKKIKFPLEENEALSEYLKPTATINSDYPNIINQAAELAEGEDDLFKVVFKLANWVEENVEYDLNTLTATASQKASWVLENKQGVCDEMTSLFIAMARSLGIPARFVSGISYTTSDLFDEKWQPHGWAEVYFPGVGWVSFDITFGEYGYVDVTHIKLRDGYDPAEPATKYQWLAERVSLNTKDLKLKTKVLSKGELQAEELDIEQEILSEEVGFGSYNLIKGIIKNNQDYYSATTLQIALPAELNVIGRNKRTILLNPNEFRETYWLVKVPKNLRDDYWYEFPIIIYSEKNVSFSKTFKAQKNGNVYTKEEIEKLTVQDEEKSYSYDILLDCNPIPEIKINEEKEISCNIKNNGNTNLNNINFCLDDNCKKINLSINQKKKSSIFVRKDAPGLKKLILSAENDLIEKKTSFEFSVVDEPKIEVSVAYPQQVLYGDKFQINVTITKKSFSKPKNIFVMVKGSDFENIWELNELNDKELLILDLKDTRISKNNQFQITTTWKNKENQLYSDQQEINIKAEAKKIFDKIKMYMNSLFKIIS